MGENVQSGKTIFHRLYLPVTRWLVMLLPVLLCYLAALKGGFVWDDPIFLQDDATYRLADNPLLAAFRNFSLSPNYFRPLVVLTFIIELRLWDQQPMPFHALNLAIHLVNTALVAMVFTRVLSRISTGVEITEKVRKWLPFAAGLVYGLHPALVESVAFVSSRFDLMVTSFLLLAMLADLSWRDQPLKRAWGVGLAFLGAALCKEMAVALLVSLPAWHLALADENERRLLHKRFPGGWWEFLRPHLPVYGGLLSATLLYLVMRSLGLGALFQPNPASSLPAGSWWQHILLVAQSYAEYMLLTTWPFTNLTPIHYTMLPLDLNFYSLANLAILLGILFGLVWLIRSKPVSAWLALGGQLALLPVANLLPLELGGYSIIAERFITFPLVFFILSAFLLLYRIKLENSLSALAGWLVGAILTIVLTLPHWRSELSLWNWAVAEAPYSYLPWINLSKALSDSGDPVNGLSTAERAIELNPYAGNAWNQLGLAHFLLGQLPEAEQAFNKALELEPQNLLYLNNLAGVLRDQGRLQEAASILIEGVLSRGNLPVAHLNLGMVYLLADRPDLAAEQLQIAIQLLPPDQADDAQTLLQQTNDPARWLGLGNILLQNNDFEGSLRAFEQAERLGAPIVEARLGGAMALIGLGQLDAAQNLLETILELASSDARLYYALGLIARERGDEELAIQSFSRAVELAPEWEAPAQALAELTANPTP